MRYKFRSALFFNQMAGPLFREKAESLAHLFDKDSILITGHPDTLRNGSNVPNLKLEVSPAYDRSSNKSRAISWLKYSTYALKRILSASSRKLIIISSNPPILNFIILVTHLMQRTSYAVIVYDIYPNVLEKIAGTSRHSPISRLWTLVNRYVYEHAIATVTLAPHMAGALAKQFNACRTPAKKILVAYPWADETKIKPLPKSENPTANELQQQNKTTILYSGNLGKSHDIDSMLEAALILKEHSQINFLFIGEGDKWQTAKDFVATHQLDTVKVLPFQPEEKLPYTMSLAEIALVALDEGAEGLMIPSKTFYYLAAGAAVIGVCRDQNDLRTVIEDSNCGICLSPRNPQRLAIAILDLSNDSKRLSKFRSNARQAAIHQYSKRTCLTQLNRDLSQAMQNAFKHPTAL